MSKRIVSKHCKVCNRRMACEVCGVNHILQLLLSLVTCGLWLPVWLLCCVTSSHPRCLTCGEKC